MACAKRKCGEVCEHYECPFPGETGYECVELVCERCGHASGNAVLDNQCEVAGCADACEGCSRTRKYR